MKTQQPMTSEQDHQVLEFRPRSQSKSSARPSESARPGGLEVQGAKRTPAMPQAVPAANSLSRYEQAREQADEFRHRILANLAAIAFTVALMAVGLWLVVSIANLRKVQDCAVMGRHDCAPPSAPHF